MVDKKLKNLQWSLLDSVSQSSANTDRCIQKELGCSKSRDINRGAMVKEGTVVTHRHIRTESSRISTLTFNKQKYLKEFHFQIGNTTALLYLVKMGGTGNQALLKLSKEICQYILKNQIIITAEFLPIFLIVEAD